MILKTLNEIREINKENLVVNKKILEVMGEGRECGGKVGKGKSVGNYKQGIIKQSST